MKAFAVLMLALAWTSAARGAPKPSESMPWTGSSLDRARSQALLGFDAGTLPDTGRALAGLKALHDRGEPMRTLVERRYGPDEGGKWRFREHNAMVIESRGLEGFDLERAEPDGARPAIDLQALGVPALETLGAPCVKTVRAFGRPSSMPQDHIITWAGGTDATFVVALSCLRGTVARATILWSTTGGSMDPSKQPTLASDDEPVGARFELGRVWPKALLPGDATRTLETLLGTGVVIGDRQLGWQLRTIMATVDAHETVTRVEVAAAARGWLAARGLPFAALGEPLDLLVKAIGVPPTTSEPGHATWNMVGPIAGGFERVSLAVSSTELAGTRYVTRMWLDRVLMVAKPACVDGPRAPLPKQRAAALAPETQVYDGRPLTLPFGLPTDPTVADLVAAIGAPHACDVGKATWYGLTATFDGESGRIERLALTADPTQLLGKRARKDAYASFFDRPVAVASPGRELLGPAGSDGTGWCFEGSDGRRVIVHANGIEGDTLPVVVYVDFESFDDLGRHVTGLSLIDLAGSARAAFGPPDGSDRSPVWDSGLITHAIDRGREMLTFTAASKAFLTRAGVGGTVVGLLGRPWTEAIARLGPPRTTQLDGHTLAFTWWDSGDWLMRQITLRCSGETPVCTVAELSRFARVDE